MCSVINVYKPPGMTSHDVIYRLRKAYGLKKIGHLGTLDPMAEGVLPACLGHATRLIEYFPSDKRYRAVVTLGKTTTTLDMEGELVETKDCASLTLTREMLEPILERFRGKIQQQVPLYSAVHVKGKRLYELAREGKTADLPTREVEIHSLKLLELDLTTDSAHPTLTLDIHCSSGTYIRSIARDIGEALSVGACLSKLIRTAHGKFSVETSIPLEDIQNNASPERYLCEPTAFVGIPLVTVTSSEAARLLLHGMKTGKEALEETTLDGKSLKLTPNSFYLARHNEQALGVIQLVSGQLKPIKMFSELNLSTLSKG